MPDDWIKMRASLLNHPQVWALVRKIHDCKDFRDWLTPGGSGPICGQIASDDALLYVVTAALLRVWSIARQHGDFVDDDLVLRYSEVEDLDVLAGIPGFGQAMQSVGWAELKNGVTLPRFKTYNHPCAKSAPMSNAERQRRYRERQREKERNETVTTKLQRITREKSRVEKKSNPPLPPFESAAWIDENAKRPLLLKADVRTAWGEFVAHRKEIRRPFTARAAKLAIRALEDIVSTDGYDTAIERINISIVSGWTGLFPPKRGGRPRTNRAAVRAKDDRYSKL